MEVNHSKGINEFQKLYIKNRVSVQKKLHRNHDA